MGPNKSNIFPWKRQEWSQNAVILISDLFPPIGNRKIVCDEHYGGARAMVSRCVVNPLGRILLRNDTSGSKNKTGQQAFKGAAARFARAEHNLEPRSDINLSTKYPNKQLHGGGPDHKNISRSLCLFNRRN
jgi:hypothetical protein